MAAVTAAGYRTSEIERIGVKEAAFHTKSNRFYQLSAFDARGASTTQTKSTGSSGWPLPFEELHHRKVVIVNVGMRGPRAKEEVATLVRLSNEISPRDGTRVLAFPSDDFGGPTTDDELAAFFADCGVHPNDASLKIMAKVSVDGPDAHPVFRYLKESANLSEVGRDFGAYFSINR